MTRVRRASDSEVLLIAESRSPRREESRGSLQGREVVSHSDLEGEDRGGAHLERAAPYRRAVDIKTDPNPETKFFLKPTNLPKIQENMSEYALTIDKVVTLVITLFVVTLMFYRGAQTLQLKKVVKDLNYVRPVLAVMMGSAAIVRIYTGFKKCHEIYHNKDPKINKKLAYAYQTTAMGQEVVNMLRALMCAVATLVLNYVPLDGASLVAGVFPGLTLAKHSFSLVQKTFEHLGTKKAATGKDDKTHSATTMLGAIVAVFEVTIASAKIANVSLEVVLGKVPMATMILFVATASVFQRYKYHSDHNEKEKHKEAELKRLEAEVSRLRAEVERQRADNAALVA